MKNELFQRVLSSIILLPISLFLIIEGAIIFNIFIFICFLISAFEWYSMIKIKLYKLYGIIFLILSFISIYKIRNDFLGEYLYLLFVTLVCVSTDMGGYLFGKIFKGPKLTKISPKKTISGMIGSYILSVIVTFAFIFFANINFSFEFILQIFILVIIISTVSQLGDISISYFKRLSKVKDTGNIIPGHGGILDRIDGMIFAFPFSYIMISLNLLNLF